MRFKKLDYANCMKYPEVANNKTLQTAFESLERETANHIHICSEIMGYLRCMYDLKVIGANTFNDCLGDLLYILGYACASKKEGK